MNARNALNDRSGALGRDKQDGINKHDAPISEYVDFLQTYDDTTWIKEDDEKKESESKAKITAAVTDEIKEEEEDDGESENEDAKGSDSPENTSLVGSVKDQAAEGDGMEDTFMSLD